MRSLPPLPDPLLIGAMAVRESRRRFHSRGELERHQDRLANRHLPWVVAHSPYTARRFESAGLAVDEWRDLPPIGKADMMAHFDGLVTVGVTLEEALRVGREAEATRDFSPTIATANGEVGVGLSTGTSGNRGVFVVTRDDRLRWASVILPALIRPFPRALLAGQRVAFFLRADGGLYRTVASRVLEFTFFDLMRPVADLAADLTAARPTLLVGPPSVLLAVARVGGVAAPEVVVSVAEVLDDADRAALAEAFGARVVEVYQATEGLLGLPCREGMLHLNEAHVHVDAEPLGDGRVRPVITDLRRRAQPMVRHRLDDVLLLAEDCACGSPTRRIVRVEGRQDDALLLPGADGGEVTMWPDFVRAAAARVDELADYRVTQTGPRVVEVEVEPLTPGVEAAVVLGLVEAMRRAGVDERRVVIHVRGLVPDEPGRKRRRVLRAPRPTGLPQ